MAGPFKSTRPLEGRGLSLRAVGKRSDGVATHLVTRRDLLSFRVDLITAVGRVEHHYGHAIAGDHVLHQIPHVPLVTRRGKRQLARTEGSDAPVELAAGPLQHVKRLYNRGRLPTHRAHITPPPPPAPRPWSSRPSRPSPAPHR